MNDSRFQVVVCLDEMSVHATVPSLSNLITTIHMNAYNHGIPCGLNVHSRSFPSADESHCSANWI